MPLPFLAMPVVHSSGMWIASNGGYIAGTLAKSWIGAFFFGNSGLLSLLGLTSAAGMLGASGSFGAWATAMLGGIGSGLGAIGLGGLATALGIAPIATVLGLTPMGWLFIGVAAVLCAGFSVIALPASVGQWIGSGLESIGLGGIARVLGIAPEPTFLGLTFDQWMIVAGVGTALLALGCVFAWTLVWFRRSRETIEAGA